MVAVLSRTIRLVRESRTRNRTSGGFAGLDFMVRAIRTRSQ